MPLPSRRASPSFWIISDRDGAFAGRGSADLKGFLSQHPERVASLTVLCPAVLDTCTLTSLGARLLIVTGDRGPGARRVQAGLPELSRATAVVLDNYAGLTWSDIAAERGDSIVAAMLKFLSGCDALSLSGLAEHEGEIAGISYRVRGAGAPLGCCRSICRPGNGSR